MIRQTRTASRRIDELLDDYMIKERDGAIDNLNRAVREALAAIEAKPSVGRPYPATYRTLADRGFSWMKIHRYWFAYSTHKGYPVLTNVFYEETDIPGRVADEDEEQVSQPDNSPARMDHGPWTMDHGPWTMDGDAGARPGISVSPSVGRGIAALPPSRATATVWTSPAASAFVAVMPGPMSRSSQAGRRGGTVTGPAATTGGS